MKLEILMNTHFDELNNNDKQALKYIISHRENLMNASCEQIAEECHISRATLLRICRKISLQSFSELKYILKEEIIKEEPQLDFERVCESYHLMIQGLKKISFTTICDRIDKAKTIYIYGTGNEQKSIAQEFKRIFLFAGKCVIDLYDYGEIEFARQGFKEEDLFVIISLSGETAEGIKIMKDLQSLVHTLSITRLQNNAISSLSECNLYAATHTLKGIQYSSYELVGIFYALLDLLFMNYLDYKNTQKIHLVRGK